MTPDHSNGTGTGVLQPISFMAATGVLTVQIASETLPLKGLIAPFRVGIVETLFARVTRLSDRLESTLSGRNGPRPWTPQLGGKIPFRGRLGNDWSARQSRHSISSAK